MKDVPTWATLVIAALALAVGWLTYRSQRGKTRLEYVVTTNTKLLPGLLAKELQVTHGAHVIEDPSLAIIRIVNTGDRPIAAHDYETPLSVTFEGVAEIASVTCTATRPGDLQPDSDIYGERVQIAPLLINPGDMIQLQVLSAGKSDNVAVEGRITNLKIVRRGSLPYPPGSGEEGEMLGFDRFMWYVLSPAVILGIGVAIALSADRDSDRAAILVVTAILAFVLYPLHVRYLVRRRRLWRP